MSVTGVEKNLNQWLTNVSIVRRVWNGVDLKGE